MYDKACNSFALVRRINDSDDDYFLKRRVESPRNSNRNNGTLIADVLKLYSRMRTAGKCIENIVLRRREVYRYSR